jgi:hypothetical protein
MTFNAAWFGVRLALCAAAGLATTTGVAWYSALTLPSQIKPTHFLPSQGPRVSGSPDSSLRDGWITREETRTATGLDVCAPFHMVTCGNAELLDEAAKARLDAFLRTSPPWDQVTPAWAVPIVEPILRAVPAGNGFADDMRFTMIEAHGWPVRALWSFEVSDLNRTPQRQVRGGLVAPAHLNPALTKYRGYGPVLPCTPIYAGLVLDSALFSAPWMLLLFAPRAVRRAIRLRRGRCPACGYDLSGVRRKCPECGRGAA